MRKPKAIVNFAKVKENDLVESAQRILNKMAKNAHFKTPIPALEVIQKALSDYSAALVNCMDGTKEDTAFKNAKRLVLDTYLSTLGGYVNIIADGDLVKLDSSGFQISKQPEHIGILDAPAYLHVEYGKNSGEVNIDMGIVAKATDYVVLYAISPAPSSDAEYYSQLFSKSKGTIKGLESGKKYVFKAAATSAESNKMNSYNFTSIVEKLVP